LRKKSSRSDCPCARHCCTAPPSRAHDRNSVRYRIHVPRRGRCRVCRYRECRLCLSLHSGIRLRVEAMIPDPTFGDLTRSCSWRRERHAIVPRVSGRSICWPESLALGFFAWSWLVEGQALDLFWRFDARAVWIMRSSGSCWSARDRRASRAATTPLFAIKVRQRRTQHDWRTI
jgi:hypothetical protein